MEDQRRDGKIIDGLVQFYFCIETTALHSMFKVFGYYDFKCPEDSMDERNWETTECAAWPAIRIKTTCRPWVLTPNIDAAMKGMESALTWCTDTCLRTFKIRNAIEHIIDNLEWDQIETVLKQNGYDKEWLADRIDEFSLWIECFYFDDEALSWIYEGEEDKLKEDHEPGERERWLMNDYD